MKILYLTNHLNPGGITSYCLTLAQGMLKNGHKAYIASSGGMLSKEFLAKGIDFLPLPLKTKSELSPKIFISLYQLARFVKKEGIDLVHANSRTTQVLAQMLKFFSGVNFVSTCHGFFKKRLSRKLYPCWGSKVIAISRQVEQHLRDDFKVRLEMISMVNNGIEARKAFSQEEKAAAKKNLNIDGQLAVGIVARLSDVKGHSYLIEAMAEVFKRFNQASLIIAGDGPMKKRLLAQVKNLGLEEKIIFLSADADRFQVLAASDVFVLPSLKEGLGLALMEAMACGLAVIGSDVGGIKTLIQDNENGLLVRPADSDCLAEAIIKLLADSQLRQALGEKAKSFIEQNFPAEKMVEQTERVYREIINDELI